MNSSIHITLSAKLDETEKARHLIELGLALDPDARSETLARLIAGSIHGGPATALERFAATGELDPESALSELNDLVVPLESEPWVDALGKHIVTSGARS
ncbi:hypothetical protein RL72_03226 [Microbacterium azadirachtae]|uniref:Uncharacterized protein n=1 Tax=Microbacterium azadirachtae TaxID=582680 RepID=A0A0F0KFD4_9MICO|nr:hypothetical protein [Microbacterium azadirachtae]KJL19573.1 hypothetical protein RL72_03226 [Microbacterium azadirachtae]